MFQLACQGRLVVAIGGLCRRLSGDIQAQWERGPWWFVIDICPGLREGSIADKSVGWILQDSGI